MVFLIILTTTGRFVLYSVGFLDLATDAADAWIPMGQAVLSGAEPYADFPDNKPPLFIFLTIIASVVGYVPFMMVIVGLANATIVVEIYGWLSRERREVAGVIAAGIGTGAILNTMVSYPMLNNKTISIAVLLISLRFRKPVHLGLGVGISCLLAQQSILAIPAIMWFRLRTIRGAVVFSITGMAVAAVSFLAIGLVWSLDSMYASVVQSLIVTGSYTAGTSSFGTQISVWNMPAVWAEKAIRRQQFLILPGVAAMFGVLYGYLKGALSKRRLFEISLAICFITLLFVRPWYHYGYYPTVPLSILGGWGVTEFVKDTL